MTYNLFVNLINHFKTIYRHRKAVRRCCFKLGLYWQGITHDLSKYSWEEFSLGVKYYQGYRSPHESERETYGFSYAWMHHKGRNKHHYEYWNDIDRVEHRYVYKEMPIKYAKEMFCDRIGACKIYRGSNYNDGSAYEYFAKSAARKQMHPNTAKLMEEWLYMLKEKGEDETFAYIKMNYPNKK